MNTDLPYNLRELGRQVLLDYPDINSGGCCVYASLVGLQLEKYGVDPKIIVASLGQVPVTESLRDLKQDRQYLTIDMWNDLDVFFNHVLISFNWKGERYIHDSENTCVWKQDQGYLGDWFFYDGYLTVNEAWRLAASPTGWNNLFPRSEIFYLAQDISRFFEGKIFCKTC